MHRRLDWIKIRKARNPWAFLVGWVWLCALAVGGGLSLLFALSAFGLPESLPVTASDFSTGPLSPLNPSPQPISTPEPGSPRPGDGPEAVPPPPTQMPRGPAETRPRSLPAASGPSKSLAGLDLWEGPRVIGTSVEGRPLEIYRFGTGSDRRMIVAGIHGGYEWNTVALADELIAHLQAHPGEVPPGVTLYILRELNPDGLARGKWYEGRLNASGVDLNRNFPSNWQAEWPNSGCWAHLPVSSGEGPASEPETQAVIDFIRAHPLTALISYHSAYLGIFPGGIPLHLPSVDLAQTVAQATTYRYPPVETGCAYTGTLADWAADQGAAALDLELHTHENTDFEENLAVLEVFLSWQPPVVSGR